MSLNAPRTVLVAIESVTREGLKQNPVVHWTLRNHARKGDKLIFIHATKHLDAKTEKAAGYTKETTAEQVVEMEKTAAETMMDLLRNYGTEIAALQLQVKIEKGDPREVLLKSIELFGAETVIVGSRGVGAMKR